ncbi:MAG: HAD family phosphatase [Candidatus Omnitrophota bacterium]
MLQDKETVTAYIFDFDGVLVDTMEAHFKCYEKACAEVGVPIDKTKFYSQAGMSGAEQIAYFSGKAGKTPDIQAVYRRKKELYADYLGLATLIKPNYMLLTSLKAAGVKVAIASGSSKGSILPLIEKFRIPYDVLVTAEDVSRGKPDPELFLKAAKNWVSFLSIA